MASRRTPELVLAWRRINRKGRPMKRLAAALVLAIPLFAGCRPEKEYVLITSWVSKSAPDMKAGETAARLSPVSFIAPTGKPLFVSLPVGEESGCCASFTVRTDGEKVALTDLYVSYGIWGGAGNGEFLGGSETGKAVVGGARDPLKVYEWEYGKKESHTDYAVYVQAEPLDSLPPMKDGAYQYKGKNYHLLRSTDPRMMKFGKEPAN